MTIFSTNTNARTCFIRKMLTWQVILRPECQAQHLLKEKLGTQKWLEHPLWNPPKWQPQKSIHFNVNAFQNAAHAISGTCCYPMLANRWPERGKFHLPLERQSLGTRCQCSSHQLWCRVRLGPSVIQRMTHIIKTSCGTWETCLTWLNNIIYSFSSFCSFKHKKTTKSIQHICGHYKHPTNSRRGVNLRNQRMMLWALWVTKPESPVLARSALFTPYLWQTKPITWWSFFSPKMWIFFDCWRPGLVSSALLNYYRSVAGRQSLLGLLR